LLAASLGALTAACSTTLPDKAPGRGEALNAHTAFLADDLLAGRDTGAPGYDIAAAYVAAQFRSAGLTPAGDQGTYFQNIALRRRSLAPDGVAFELQLGERRLDLANGVGIAVDPSPYATDETIDAEIVFAGWGISAPQLGFDDYAGLDVRGKAVVILEGAPASLQGSVRAHFSWIQQKERMAAARGAVALLTLKSPARERFSPWERARLYRPLPAITWLGQTADNANRIRATITLGPDAARALFRHKDVDLDALYTDSELEPPKGFAMDARVRMTRRSVHEPVRSSNVVAILPGTDPRLRNEYVVVLGHLDHVGIGPAVNGDTIYNGAIDNAGGIAVLLEAAKALAAGPAPRRSILFVATTGEEKGLVGAEYLAANPVVPMDRIAAAISVDGLMAFNDFTGIVALGADHSSLGPISAKAARSVGAVHVPDPIPDRGNLALSDQYPFLRAGIPVLFPNPARETVPPDPQGILDWDTYEERHYHQPSDDMKLPIRWDSAARWLDYIEGVIRGAADEPTAIRWNEGDILGRAFGRARPAPTDEVRD
jgi:hypothetical protein